jgi:hypothetical protein
MRGIPGGVKELLAEMQDFYNYCYASGQDATNDNLIGTIF